VSRAARRAARPFARRAAWLAAALWLAAGCGGPEPTPEQQVRAAIADAERAATEHDFGALRDRIAADYRDAAGRDKAGLESILRIHFLRNQRIHLLVRVRELAVDVEAGTATVEALVATAGRPIAGLEGLATLDADLLWVDLGLARREDAWRVTRASWERARLEDLL